MAQAGAQPPSDAQLVSDLRAGRIGALDELYRRHAPTVVRVIGRTTREREAVADLVQECFARVLERIDSLTEPDRFRAWLLAIARHTAIDAGRRQVRQRTDALSDAAAAELRSTALGPDETAELNELGRLVGGVVAGLSPRDATALTLVTRFGLAPEEVAVALGVSTTGARVALHRARRRLRDALRLHLLARGGRGCAAFEEALAGDALDAARHARTCEICTRVADDEIALYEQEATSETPH